MKTDRSLSWKTVLLVLLLPILVFGVKKIIDIRRGAAGNPADIVVDLHGLQDTLSPSLWQNLAQGGEEPVDMIAPALLPVRSLKPQLIRIDHLYDYYQVYQGPGNFDFSRLDKVVNSILLAGAKPMFSLSYTPSNMAKDGQNAGEPNDWNQWYQLVKATAYRYSFQKNIPGIYYEVWNEPDLFGHWHYAKTPSYTTLYIQSARAVADGAANTVYKIGGPATTAYYPGWIKSLLQTASDNNLRLDFLSWHKYSQNIDDFVKDTDNITGLLSGYPKYANMERMITESGPDSEPNSCYDNSSSAAHLLSLVTQLSGRIHRIFTFEIIDGPTPRSQGSSGWGIITHADKGLKLKPRYFALQLLNQMHGIKLTSTGNGSWVSALAAKDNSITQLLLVNYDPANSHTETVPVTFLSVNPGKYTLKVTNFLGNSITKTITISTFRYNDAFYLNPNSAVLLELSPI